MNIEKKLNDMKPKDTPLLVLGYILLGMMLLLPATAKADNEVVLDQEGDNVVVDIMQAGAINKIDIVLGLNNNTNNTLKIGQGHSEGAESNNVFFSVDGTHNTMQIEQHGSNNEVGWTNAWGTGIGFGGDLDGNSNQIYFHQNCTRGASCGKSDIGFHIKGNSNTVRYGQGVWFGSGGSISSTTFYDDGDEGGNHTATLDIHGNNNTLVGMQRNGSLDTYDGHTANLYLYADDNTLYVNQQTDGAKTLNYSSYVDGTVGSITQHSNGAHTATIVLNGTQPSNLTLLQSSNSAKSYSLTQTCHTVGGCSISVTQD